MCAISLPTYTITGNLSFDKLSPGWDDFVSVAFVAYKLISSVLPHSRAMQSYFIIYTYILHVW